MSIFGRVAAAVGLVVVVWSAMVVAAPAAGAHPLGNFTTNTALALRLSPDRVEVDYAVDEAEIPTVRAQRTIEAVGLTAYARTTCDEVVAKVAVTVGGEAVTFTVEASGAEFAAGEAGLQTLRVDCALSAPADLANDDTEVSVSDGWVADRVGWHEMTAVGGGVAFGRGAPPSVSSSGHLRTYPSEGLAAPPDLTSATFTSTPGISTAGGERDSDAVPSATSAGSVSAVPGVDEASRSFTDLVSTKRLTFGVAIVGLVLAVLLGSLHALAPGHGKTVMAAYLLGGEGSARQALTLCATVTVTHTAGVLVLGTVLTVSTVVAPERLYPILGAISGLLVASIGISMLRRARRFRSQDMLAGVVRERVAALPSPTPTPHRSPRRQLVGAGVGAQVGRSRVVGANQRGPIASHDHTRHRFHSHGHSHALGAHTHSHGAYSHSHPDLSEPVSWKSLIGMGFAGGMVPSPSALLVLLGAIALGRTWFGVLLVIAYGLGMALSLVAAGLLLLRLRNRLDAYLATRHGAEMSRRLAIMPALTASFVVIGGLYLAARAVAGF